ncbi:MAG: twin-arginine translocation signal domain-containing protein [Candidatus Omnitrophota bacterium]|nr:twin-arginine translocation signal domain-containing protein [Candidatus Omnitrophota bacterium]
MEEKRGVPGWALVAGGILVGAASTVAIMNQWAAPPAQSPAAQVAPAPLDKPLQPSAASYLALSEGVIADPDRLIKISPEESFIVVWKYNHPEKKARLVELDLRFAPITDRNQDEPLVVDWDNPTIYRPPTPWVTVQGENSLKLEITPSALQGDVGKPGKYWVRVQMSREVESGEMQPLGNPSFGILEINDGKNEDSGVEENTLTRRQFLGATAVGTLPLVLPSIGGAQEAIKLVVNQNLSIPATDLPDGLLEQKRVRLVDVNRSNDVAFRRTEELLEAIQKDPSFKVVIVDIEGGWVTAGATVFPKGVSLIGGHATTNWDGDIVVDGGTVANLSIEGKVTLRNGAQLLNSVVVGEVNVLGDKNVIRGNQIIADTIVRRSRQANLHTRDGVLYLNRGSSEVVLDGGAAIDVGTTEAASNGNVIEGNLVVYPHVDPKDGRLFDQKKQLGEQAPDKRLESIRSAAVHIRRGRGNRLKSNTLVNFYPFNAAVLMGPWRLPSLPDEASKDTSDTRLEGNVLAVNDIGLGTDKAVIQGEFFQIVGGNNLVIGGQKEVAHPIEDRHVPAKALDGVFQGGNRVPILERQQDKGEFRPADYRIKPELLGRGKVGVFQQSSSDKAGLEEDLNRRQFLTQSTAAVGAVAVSAALDPLNTLLAQVPNTSENQELRRRIQAMAAPAQSPTYYSSAVRFVDGQRIRGRAPVVPGNLPAAKAGFKGFNLNGLSQSYRSDPANPSWNVNSPIAQYGRVWVYDAALGILSDLAAIQLNLAGGYTDSAVQRFALVRVAANALVDLGKAEETMGFAGGWRFSYNTEGDNWMDPRAPMGAVLWGINSLYQYIELVLTSENPTISRYRNEALDLLDWTNKLVKRLVFSLQVMDEKDPRDGLIRNTVYNSLLDTGLSLDAVGYRPFEGEINKRGEHAIFEHNADLADVFRNAGHVNAIAGKLDRRFQDAAFRSQLITRHDRLLKALYEKAWVGDHFVTAMEPDGTLNTSVAIDNNTWVAGVFLPYDEDRVWNALEYVWNEFRAKGRDGETATRFDQLVLEDVPPAGRAVVQKYGKEAIAGVHFFGRNFKDPYVDVPQAERHKLEEMIQPEANEGLRDLLVKFAITTRDPVRRETALKRAELITKTLAILKEVYGALPYATLNVQGLMSTLHGMASNGSASIVAARLQGARASLIGVTPPADFTFRGRKPGETSPVSPVTKPTVQPTKPADKPKPGAEAPKELEVSVTDLKAQTMTVQLQIPADLKGKSLVAAAFIHVEGDTWYIQPTDDESAMKKVGANGQVTLTTVVPRSPFIGKNAQGFTTDNRAVVVFESAAVFKAFVADYQTTGIRAVDRHAVKIFIIDEKKKVQAAKRLAFAPSVESSLFSSTSVRGPRVDVGPESKAFAASQRSLSPAVLLAASASDAVTLSPVLAAGVEETRRGFLQAAVAAALPALRLSGLFENGSDQLADDASSRVANVERGRKETVIYKLELKSGETTPASLPPVTRLLVQRGAEIPSVWKDLPVSWLDEDASKAQQEIGRLEAQPGEIVLIRPVDNETARGWDQYLLSKQLLGIQATTDVAGLIDTLSREGQLAILLGSLGENGGLILWATVDERTTDERYLVVHA